MADTSNLGVRWDILANIGKNAVDAYDAGQNQAIENDRRSRLAALGDDATPQDIARTLLRTGDSKGALAAIQMAQTAKDRQFDQALQAAQFKRQGENDTFGHGLSVAQLRQQRDQAAASRVPQGYEPNPSAPGGVRPLSGGPQDPATLQRNQQIAASNREMSGTDKQAILESENALTAGKQAIESLKRAAELNENAFSGLGSSVPTAFNAAIPDAIAPYIGNKQRALDTLELNNLMKHQVLTNLKATFGGNPSNREGSILSEVEGGEGLPMATRRGIINRALATANDRLKMHEERLKQLRAGTYFEPEGSPRTQSTATAAVATSGKPSAAVRFRQLTSGGASKEDAFKTMLNEGYE
jgi:hypothetical protein